jgi:hypothetical protein
MQGQGLEWDEGYRGLGRQEIAAILTGQMGKRSTITLSGWRCSTGPTGAMARIGGIC